MKIALITTTIHVPRVLALYRKYGPGVEMFVAGDNKTDPAAEPFCESIGARYLSAAWQRSTGYKCSDLLGWNTKARRNIATLEALKWGADVIVIIDDDNIPVDNLYFDHYTNLFYNDFSGMQVRSEHGCVDTGALLVPPVVQRGFPFGRDTVVNRTPIVDARIGLAQGLTIGDPDISATERLERAPMVHGVTELARAGIVVGGSDFCVVNSQNTAVAREFAVGMLLPTAHWHRYDDIFAGLITHRLVSMRGAFTHVGQPFTWQERNPHNTFRDLQAEMWGMEHCAEFMNWLRPATPDDRTSNIDMVREIYANMSNLPWMPEGMGTLGMAWCDDVEQAMR